MTSASYSPLDDLGQVASSPWVIPFERRNDVLALPRFESQCSGTLAASKEVALRPNPCSARHRHFTRRPQCELATDTSNKALAVVLQSSQESRVYVSRHAISRLFGSSCLCGMIGLEWSRFPFSVANCFYALPSDPIDQLRIWQPCFPGCESEVFVVCENGIWVRLDKIQLVLRRKTQIDSRIAVDR